MHKLLAGTFSLLLLTHTPAFADLSSDATDAGYYKTIADAQNAQLTNIIQATKAPDVKNSVAAPTSMVATATRDFNEALTAWLERDDNPIFKTLEADSCTSIIAFKDSIISSLDVYRIANSRITETWKNLRASETKLSTLNSGSVKIETWAAPLVVGVLLNAAISYAPLMKKAYATSSASVDQASALFSANLAAHLYDRENLKGREFIDSDFNLGGTYNPAIVSYCKKDINEKEFDSGSLSSKINCLSAAVREAQALLDTINLPDAAKDESEPNKTKRKYFNALKSDVDSATTELALLLTADKSTGLYPYNVGMRGEILNKAVEGGACLLTSSIISANTDSVATDAWYTTYKLYSTTYATIAWRIAGADGKVKKAGFYPLTKEWHRQKLQPD